MTHSRRTHVHFSKHFVPLAAHGEVLLLQHDTPQFDQTKQYLTPLITDALTRFALSETGLRELRDALLADVSIAAHRFLSDPQNLTGEYTFSVYFTWYIKKRIAAVSTQRRNDR